jgi:hypothetical protein
LQVLESIFFLSVCLLLYSSQFMLLRIWKWCQSIN